MWRYRHDISQISAAQRAAIVAFQIEIGESVVDEIHRLSVDQEGLVVKGQIGWVRD